MALWDFTRVSETDAMVIYEMDIDPIDTTGLSGYVDIGFQPQWITVYTKGGGIILKDTNYCPPLAVAEGTPLDAKIIWENIPFEPSSSEEGGYRLTVTGGGWINFKDSLVIVCHK